MSATAGRPRLLFISPRFLFPMDQGGKIRTGNILRGMKGGAFEVTLASPAPPDVNRFSRRPGSRLRPVRLLARTRANAHRPPAVVGERGTRRGGQRPVDRRAVPVSPRR